MPDAIIELDLTTPWEPSEPPAPPPGRPGSRRWLAVAAVVLVTAGLLVAAVPRRGTAPVFTVDFQMLGINAGGGRLFLARYQTTAAGPLIEALDIRDGTRLWSLSMHLNQHLAYVTDRVVAMMAESAGADGADSTLTMLDAATGRILWERQCTRLVGRAGDRLVVEEVPEVTEVPEAGDPVRTQTTQIDGLNFPADTRAARVVAVDQWTGAVAWEVEVPEGSLADFDSTDDHTEITGLRELSSTGLLRTRDIGSGAVTGTHQLQWSGIIAGFATGIDGQVVLYPAFESGADVYDRATGRLLWHWLDGQQYGGLFPCLPDRYCVRDGAGLGTVDAGTGAQLWHVDRYDGIINRGPGTLLVAVFQQIEMAPSELAVVDVRTGAVRAHLEDWYVAPVYTQRLGDRIVVWRPVGTRDAVLATVDPRTARITVFGRATDWIGRPECVQEDGRLACVVAGGLSVWRLP